MTDSSNRGHPRVLAVMPVWNAESTLQEALESVLAQEGVSFHLLAIDDGSTDGSLKLLLQQRDPRVIVQQRPHLGLCPVMNDAIRFASSQGYEYLMRMDADDVSKAARFERLVQFLDRNPEYAAVSSNCEYFTSDGKGSGTSTVSVQPGRVAFEIKHGLRGLIQGASCFRVSALVAVDGYRAQFQAAEDADLFLRLSERFPLANLPDFLYRIRVSPNSRSRSNLRRNVWYAHYALDCARRRARGVPERSFEGFAAWADRFSVSARLEYWSMWLWEVSHKGGWRKGLIPLAALMSPMRVYARIMRTAAG